MADDPSQLPYASPMLEPTEVLSWNEICERFPERWVAVIDYELGEPSGLRRIARGRVVGHAESPYKLEPKPTNPRWSNVPLDELVELSRSYKPDVAHDYTGAEYTYPHGVLTCYFARISTPTTP